MRSLLIMAAACFSLSACTTTSIDTAIQTNLLRDFYVTLGEGDPRQGWVIRLYLNPLAPWIWLGALIMAIGGFLSLSDRRLRVGAPVRARASTHPAGAASSP